MKTLKTNVTRPKGYAVLAVFCILYWLLESACAYFSFEYNIEQLIVLKPSSLLDSILLQVPPYQVLSRLMVVALFLLAGTLIIEIMHKKERAERERRLMQQALLESEERFRLVLSDISMVSVQGYAADGTTSYWNEGSRLLYGYTAEEAIGRNLLDLIIPPEMKEAVAEEIRKMNETGRPIPASELTLMRKDGSRVKVYSSHSFLKRSGHPPEFFCIDIDLSKIKKVEKEREKLKAQLTQAQKLEAVGRLAGGIAHDYNNMLGVILGRAEIAMEGLDENDPLAEDLREISRAAQHSADITRQLLTFARRQTVTPRVVDLNETVEATLKMIRRLIGEDIELSWYPGKNLWPVRIDPTQVDQLMANLCVNARDAIADIGTISIGTENVSLDAVAADDRPEVEPGDFVMLVITDTGTGMDTETKSNIFEPFFTTKGNGKGTGLGLATVYGIVKQNGGTINVYSEPGSGTSFKIYLPRYIGEENKIVDEKAGEIAQGQGEVVLLVEDEPAILELGQKMISRLGYTVIGLDSPAAAQKLVEAGETPIDLLITDVVLPGMNGRDLAEKLLAQRPQMKVVFMSGYTADVISDRGVLNEGVDFIQKPFTQRAMAEKIHTVLSGRKR